MRRARRMGRPHRGGRDESPAPRGTVLRIWRAKTLGVGCGELAQSPLVHVRRRAAVPRDLALEQRDQLRLRGQVGPFAATSTRRNVAPPTHSPHRWTLTLSPGGTGRSLTMSDTRMRPQRGPRAVEGTHPLRPRRHRHGGTRLRTGSRGGRVPHERDRLHGDPSTAAPGRDRRRTHREMAQSFARLGSRVTLLEAAGQVLPPDRPGSPGRRVGLLKVHVRKGTDRPAGATLAQLAQSRW